MLFFWNAAPLSRLLIPFLSGILFHIFCLGHSEPVQILIVTFIVFLVNLTYYLFRNSGEEMQGLMFFMLIFFCGLSAYSVKHWKDKEIQTKWDNTNSWIKVKLLEDPVFKYNSARAKVNIENIRGFSINCNADISGDQLSEYHTGDRLYAFGTLTATVPDVFPVGMDYGTYRIRKGILFKLKAERIRYIGPEENFFLSCSLRLRKKVLESLSNSGFNKSELGFAEGLLLGKTDEVDAEQYLSYQVTGTLHILSVSGLHVAFIYGIFSFIFKIFGNNIKMRILRSGVILIFLWMYAVLTGMSPPIIRSALMLTVIVFSGLINRRSSTLNALCFAAFILLVVNVNLIFDIGFQFSFLALLGLICFHEPLSKIWEPTSYVTSQIWSLVCASVSAQAFTLPLSLYYFSVFPLYFIPANLIIVPLSGLAIYGLVLLSVIPYISIYASAVGLLLDIINKVAAWFAGLPLASLTFPLDKPLVLVGFIFSFLLLLLIHTKRKVTIICLMLTLAGAFQIFRIMEIKIIRAQLYVLNPIKPILVFIDKEEIIILRNIKDNAFQQRINRLKQNKLKKLTVGDIDSFPGNTLQAYHGKICYKGIISGTDLKEFQRHITEIPMKSGKMIYVNF